MRRILLTPSQVSVLVTTFVVLSCTTALFLSGYAIQQRTLRDLRKAIKPRQPRAKPTVYLPEKFRTTQTLEDGTIIQIESEAERERRELEGNGAQVVEVKPTMAEPASEQRGEDSQYDGLATSGQLAMVAALQADVAQKSWGVEHPDPMAKSKVLVTRAERRRLIKEEVQRLSRSKEKVYYQRRLW